MINESDVLPLKRITSFMAAAVIAFLLIVCVFTTGAFADMAMEYNVIIDDNGKQSTVATEETEPIEILAEANITLGSNDILNISGFTAGEGGTIKVDRLNTVNIQLDDVITQYDVYADTVSEALSEIGLGDDYSATNYSADEYVENGMVIIVSKLLDITIEADGNTYELTVFKSTVEELLDELGISLGSDDYTEPSLDTKIENGMTITVCRVEIKTVTETETISYDTETISDSDLEAGETRTGTSGVDGEKSVTYEVTYVNGEAQSKTEVSSTVTKEPVTEVIYVGTKTSVSSNGVESYNGYTVGQTISGKYTYYCACTTCCGSSSGVTASGKKVYNGMDNPYYVACNWLPLGSVIQIDGVNYTVVDRGGSSLSTEGRVDIFTPDGHSAALKGGTGSCEIVIVRLGW